MENTLDVHGSGSYSPDKKVADQTYNRRVARLAIGVTLTFLVVMAYDWTLSYLAPCFVIPLLQARAAPSLPTVVRILLVAFIIMLMCYWVAGVARIFPLLFLVSLIPILYQTFCYSLRGGSKLIVLLLLIGFMLLPMVMKASPEISWDYSASFFWNISLALAINAIMFSIFPTLPSEPTPAPKPVIPAAEVDRRALIMALITGSFTLAYFSFDWTNVHTPIYIAIFIHQLSLARGLGFTKAILTANIAAGLIAMLLYTLLAMATNFVFLMVLSLTVMLIFARMIMSEAPWAPLASTALSSMLIIFGSAMGSFDDGSGNMFIDRMGEIGVAALYTITSLYVLEAFLPEKPA